MNKIISEKKPKLEQRRFKGNENTDQQEVIELKKGI